jgi:hypothetical protein
MPTETSHRNVPKYQTAISMIEYFLIPILLIAYQDHSDSLMNDRFLHEKIPSR